MADYNSDRTGSNIDAVLDKADNLTQAAVGVGGNVGIGTASPSAPLSLNRTVSDGTILDLRKDGATVGSIGSVIGQYLRIGTSDTGIMFQDGTSAIEPRTESGNNDASINLGATSNRFKDLYLSGGVYLGGTGAANKLDDYEEGTWTPTNNGDSTGTVTSTGTYTKVGKQVTVQGVIRIDSNFDGAAFAGLPFTPSGNSGISGVRGIFNTFSDNRDLYLRLVQGTTLFNVYLDLNGTRAYPATADGPIRFLMSYETNA